MGEFDGLRHLVITGVFSFDIIVFMKIGLFDSGLGGLTILKAVAKMLPDYDYEFYGDTANLPYGNKTEEEIYELTKAGVKHLFERECSLIIIACNTASAETLRRIQDGYLKDSYPDRRILGVIIPTVEEVHAAALKRVLLIGTKRTIESGKYDKELSKVDSATELISLATPELVPLIEMGLIDDAFNQVLSLVVKVGEVNGLILGCTHYSLLGQKLSEHYADKKIKIFSQDIVIPEKLKTYLSHHPEIETKLTRGSTRSIFLTDNSSRYDGVIRELLGGVFIEE